MQAHPRLLSTALMGIAVLVVGVSSPRIGSLLFQNLGVRSLIQSVTQIDGFVADGDETWRTCAGEGGHFAAAIHLNERNTRAHRGLALARYGQGDLVGALVHAGDTVELQPRDRGNLFLLGFLAFALHDHEKAITVWRQAGAASYFLMRATVAHKARRFSEAIRWYRVAEEIEPAAEVSVDLREAMAWAFYEEREKEVAEFVLNTLVQELGVSNDRAWLLARIRRDLGMLFLRENDWTRAVDNLQQAVVLDPTVVEYRCWLAKAYMYSGQLDRAEVELTVSLRSRTDSPVRATALALLGELYTAKGDLSNAIRAYSQAVDLTPKDMEYRWYLIQTYLSVGDRKHAIAELQKALELAPHDDRLNAQYRHLMDRRSPTEPE